jgi:UDP-N-acetylmuramyl pentapeptide phosphotransferase/UDP-N-acetylglucosamine-1-phosphate transferase
MPAAEPGSLLLLLLLTVVATLAATLSTGLVTRALRRRAILDHPNERSSHTVPVPRGGGWGILAVVAPGWLWLGVSPLVLAGLALLAAVSWIDDRRNLAPALRLVVQAAAVGLGLIALGDQGRLFQGALPDWLDHGIAGLGWLWFLNLFNFMDGIDGLAGGEAVSVALGLALVTSLGAGGLSAVGAGSLTGPALVLAGAGAGFLVWNWQPARVFMGDVGSVPIGFGLGWLLLAAAGQGLWPAALLLPLYFLTDATVTLLRRAAAGKPVLQAHREHFYQKAVQSGWSHARVVWAVLVTNAGLIALAVLAPAVGWPVLGVGAALVLMLLWRLGHAITTPSPCRHNSAELTAKTRRGGP